MLNQFLGVQIRYAPKTLAIKKDSDVENGTQIHKNPSASAGNVEPPISFLITQKRCCPIFSTEFAPILKDCEKFYFHLAIGSF